MVLLEQLGSPPHRVPPAAVSRHVGGQDRYELALIPSGGGGNASPGELKDLRCPIELIQNKAHSKCDNLGLAEGFGGKE
jgi:hypothetical protein